jgi:hypothetical protein
MPATSAGMTSQLRKAVGISLRAKHLAEGPFSPQASDLSVAAELAPISRSGGQSGITVCNR